MFAGQAADACNNEASGYRRSVRGGSRPLSLRRVRRMSLENASRHHMPVDVQLVGRETECEPDQLRQMQNRHVELFADVHLDFTLEALHDRMAERAGPH